MNIRSEQGYGVFIPSSTVLFPSQDSIHYSGVPDILKEYVVRGIHLQPIQYIWYQYKKGNINKESIAREISRTNTDTTKLSDHFIDEEVIILIGTNHNDKRVIIVDSDNNEDFSGEKILEYEYPLTLEKQKEIAPLLPIIPTKYELFFDGKIIKRTSNILTVGIN